MYRIKYTVSGFSALWSDPTIRGNTEPLEYHSYEMAEQEIEFLSLQYANEGYTFTIINKHEGEQHEQVHQ